MSIIVVDDFYADPDSVRDFALEQEFNIRGEFPAVRGGYYFPEDTVNKIQTIIYPFGGQIIRYFGHTGVFQLCTAFDRTKVHSDYMPQYTEQVWAGVVYLSPNAPLSAGTGFFKCTKTNKFSDDPPHPNPNTEYHMENCLDQTKFEMVSVIGNVYNRAIFYKGNLLHRAMDYFGFDKTNARLTQTFFFCVENK